MKICQKCLISGRVQGVFFRASTQKRALELGVNGWARNLPDGRVEVLACGEEQAVNSFVKWLWEGPPASRVERVDCEEQVLQQVSGFHTG